MYFDSRPISRLLDKAAAQNRFSLLEHEVYAVLEAAGCSVPKFILVEPGQTVAIDDLNKLNGSEVILKVVSPEIAHKTDVGGVRKVPASVEAISAAMQEMLDTIPHRYLEWIARHPDLMPPEFQNDPPETVSAKIAKSIQGFLVVEKIAARQTGPGSELLLGLRYNREFGPVLTIGIGGVDTELLGAACRPGQAVISLPATRIFLPEMLEIMKPTLVYRRLRGLTRGGEELVSDDEILRVLHAFRMTACTLGSERSDDWTITELEVNPFAAADGKLVVLDGLLKFRRVRELPLPRPADSIDALLHPKSIGIIGVSAKGMNMGRIIMRNVIDAGFDPTRLYVVRPGQDEIDGVKCVPSVEALPERVDTFVLAVGADQVPDVLSDLMKHDKAIGVILIAGGLAEKEGGAAIEQKLKASLREGRLAEKPLVINGGNSLGIVSRPGKYHTLFIPTNKLPLNTTGLGNVAFVSQSGAYMITRMSKMDWLSPRFAISLGNQTDLTVADYIWYLTMDDDVHTLAVYVEGFQDRDGLLCATGIDECVSNGKDVIFFKAGRTAEGKTATSGHTASLAGDYDVCASIMRNARAHVAPTFDDFQNLVKLSSMLGGKKWKGNRIAAMSNAGYETVGIADSLRGDGWNLSLASLQPETKARLSKSLVAGKLDALVDVRNPLDVTPMANDQVYEDVMRAFLEDPEVDIALCATVPLTPTMATLATGVPPESSIE
ncbi:MAG: acetate--CoA ligase family protein, partial [Polyangiaceae bacterium]|nr:acetate--CoA ligase family protein [Polyangiaceae bacterium]